MIQAAATARYVRTSAQKAGLVLALAVVYTAVHAVVLAKVRFRLPIDVLVIVYGCGGLVAAWDLVTARRPDAAGRDRGR